MCLDLIHYRFLFLSQNNFSSKPVTDLNEISVVNGTDCFALAFWPLFFVVLLDMLIADLSVSQLRLLDRFQ